MYEQIAANKRKTIGLMFGFFVLVGGLAWLLATVYHRQSLLLTMGVFSIGYALWGYYASSGLALSINGAQQIQKQDDPRLWRTVENIAITTGMPMPKVYIMNDPALNAFATGRDPQHASVAITSGLLNALETSELQARESRQPSRSRPRSSRLCGSSHRANANIPRIISTKLEPCSS